MNVSKEIRLKKSSWGQPKSNFIVDGRRRMMMIAYYLISPAIAGGIHSIFKGMFHALKRQYDVSC